MSFLFRKSMTDKVVLQDAFAKVHRHALIAQRTSLYTYNACSYIEESIEQARRFFAVHFVATSKNKNFRPNRMFSCSLILSLSLSSAANCSCNEKQQTSDSYIVECNDYDFCSPDRFLCKCNYRLRSLTAHRHTDAKLLIQYQRDTRK